MNLHLSGEGERAAANHRNGSIAKRVLIDTEALPPFEPADIRSTENNYSIRDRSTDRIVCEIRRRAGQQKMDLDVSVLMHTPDGFLIHANPAQSNIRAPHDDEIVRGRQAAISL